MPTPRPSCPSALGMFLGCALSAFLSGRAAFAAEVPASSPLRDPESACREVDARSKVASAADKQKVPKPTSSAPPPKVKGGDNSGQNNNSDHSDDSDSDCLNNCFVGFGSLLESPTPPPASQPGNAFASEASYWAVGSQAWLVAPTAVDSVGLWDAPAEPEHPGIETGRLPHGSHVVVVETHSMASGFWTRVRPFDGVEPSGWIPSWLLTNAPAPKPAPARPHYPDPRWGLRLLLAYGGIGPTDLNVEYSDGAIRADIQYMRLLKKQWISGFGFGYRSLYGHPQTAYLSGNTLDDPQQSRLQIYEIGTRAGQIYADRSGFRFDWMLGPTLAYVDERAKLNVYTVVPINTLVPAGTRDEALGRWAGGGEMRMNIGWCSRTNSEWGLHLGAFMYAWEGHGEKSLATDFVHSNIHGWDVGLSFSFFD